ncbi:MAG: energy-dependent translational throttle protein EttA [Planctomycetes bacterium]|jgi:ATP-binding cassette ChvD family protein|nr:energy-dependent translational throttle protein EttA [Planctomycetota bacterium]
MSEKINFHLIDLKKYYGQREVLKGITLSFLEGAKIGLIGPNGAGKSTLLRIIAGEDKNFEGEAKAKAGLTIGYLPQEPALNEEKTVAENVDEAIEHLRAIEARYYEVMNLLGDAEGAEAEKLNTEYDHLQHEMDSKDIWNIDSWLKQAKAALCLPPDEAEVQVLSGGERRRVALCKLLIDHPDLLLLDEPTNHLDADTVAWLEEHLANYDGTVILVTHDRYFLDNVVGWMLEIERGRGTPYKGNYSDYLDAKQGELDVKRQADAKTDRLIKKEKEWKGRTPAARATHNKARLQRYKEMVEKRREDAVESIELQIPPGDRLGDKVIEVRDLTKGYGDRVLIRGLSFDLPPGAILGVVGANGMGKTTLMRMILGQEEPDSGEIQIGPTVKLTYLDQSRAILDDEKTVYENITEGNDLIPYGNATLEGRAYAARFNFRGEDQQKKLGECSGGMRNRVLLARMLRHGGNVVILDEPTNDLDLDTLRVLENAIDTFPGSAIVVSHDRWFLNRLVSHILAFEGDGYVNFHYGTFESYVEWRKEWREKSDFPLDSQAGRYRKFRG